MGAKTTAEKGESAFTPTRIQSDDYGNLEDQTGNKYSGRFDGKNVAFTDEEGITSKGSWIQGSNSTTGIRGGGDLSDTFNFTFYDPGGGNQRLNATWTFAGSADEAVRAWRTAGYRESYLDDRFNKGHQPPAGGSLIHMRSPGNWFTGADSGHAIIAVPRETTLPTSGEVHVGEHNPTTNFPVGFMLHRKEAKVDHV